MCNIGALLLTICMTVASFGMTIDDIIARTAQHPAQPSCAYQVSIVTVVSMGQQTLKDSGTLEICPPDCYHIVLSNGKIDQSGCGDTSWITGQDGSITRKIGNGADEQFKTPDVAAMLKKQNARIVSDTGKMIVLEMALPADKSTAKVQLSIDTTEWLVRKSFVLTEGMPVESGYAYETFDGKPVVSQISTVMATGGFMKISFLNYTKIKKPKRSKYRKL